MKVNLLRVDHVPFFVMLDFDETCFRADEELSGIALSSIIGFRYLFYNALLCDLEVSEVNDAQLALKSDP